MLAGNSAKEKFLWNLGFSIRENSKSVEIMREGSGVGDGERQHAVSLD